MSIIESLDLLSNKMNEVADNILQGDKPLDSELIKNKGLDGLGLINENKKDEAIESPKSESLKIVDLKRKRTHLT